MTVADLMAMEVFLTSPRKKSWSLMPSCEMSVNVGCRYIAVFSDLQPYCYL